MNDVVPADVLELHRRMGRGGPYVSGALGFAPNAAPSPVSREGFAAPGSEPENENGLSPVSSSGSLGHEGTPSPPKSRPGTFQAVAIHCKFVGGGHQGSVDLCATICLVDEQGHVLLDTVVKPSLPVTDYRFASTGLTAEDVSRGMPFKKARKIVLGFLKGAALSEGIGSSPAKTPGGQGRSHVLLVGIDLLHTLNCLMLEHPHKYLRELDHAGASRVLAQGAGSFAPRNNADIARLLLQKYMETP